MLPFTGFINTTNNFDFELHTIKQEHDLKLMVINDRKLCLTLWQLKWCLWGNDKSVYSRFQILSLVDFDINISVSLSHVINIGSVLYTLFTLRSSPALQQIEPHTQPPPKQMKSSGVQSVINGEDRNVNNVYNTDPMLITCDNETDIFISKSTKDKIWNGLFTGSSCSSTLLLSTHHWIGVGSYLL
jgi:hypothetical protein